MNFEKLESKVMYERNIRMVRNYRERYLCGLDLREAKMKILAYIKRKNICLSDGEIVKIIRRQEINHTYSK